VSAVFGRVTSSLRSKSQWSFPHLSTLTGHGSSTERLSCLLMVVSKDKTIYKII